MTSAESGNQLQSISLAFQGFVVGLILVVFSMISLQVANVQFGLSFLPVAAFLFWPDRASYTWSLFFIFLIGMFHDFVSFGPLGLRTICYLLLFIAMGGGLRMKLNLGAALGGFTLGIGFILTVIMMIGRLFMGYWPSWTNLMTDGLASVMVFPIIFWLLSLRNSIVPDHERREVR